VQHQMAEWLAEVLCQVGNYVDWRSLLTLRTVCKHWNSAYVELVEPFSFKIFHITTGYDRAWNGSNETFEYADGEKFLLLSENGNFAYRVLYKMSDTPDGNWRDIYENVKGTWLEKRDFSGKSILFSGKGKRHSYNNGHRLIIEDVQAVFSEKYPIGGGKYFRLQVSDPILFWETMERDDILDMMNWKTRHKMTSKEIKKLNPSTEIPPCWWTSKTSHRILPQPKIKCEPNGKVDRGESFRALYQYSEPQSQSNETSRLNFGKGIVKWYTILT